MKALGKIPESQCLQGAIYRRLDCEMGSFGLDEFREVKSIIVDTTGEPIGLYTAD